MQDRRRYSHPLRAGHKAAFMYTESTTYKYLENLDAPKDWFKANVDTVLKTYGEAHRIGREDVCFGSCLPFDPLTRHKANQGLPTFTVIGTLNTADYALFVSHNHPDGQVRCHDVLSRDEVSDQILGALQRASYESTTALGCDKHQHGGVAGWTVV